MSSIFSQASSFRSPVSIVIVHGWEAAPDSNWFPWLKKNLEEDGIKCVVPAMPNSAFPKLDEWVQALNSAVKRATNHEPREKIILIGHSLGCITIVHYLNRNSKARIDGAVFVAGFSGNIRIQAIKEFYEMPVDLKDAASKMGQSISIHSQDDRAVPMQKSKEFAQGLNSEMIEVNGYGHFTGSEGVTQLPLILPEIQKLI